MPKNTKNAVKHHKGPKSPNMPKITEMLKIRENAKNHRKYQRSPRMPKIANKAKNHQILPPT